VSGFPAAAGPFSLHGAGDADRVAGEYLVTVRPPADEGAVRASFASLGVVDVRRIAENLFLVRLARDPGPAEVERVGRATPGLAAIQPNVIYRAQPR
jgi:hypothetical protein